jgi:DNA topoisomerase IA
VVASLGIQQSFTLRGGDAALKSESSYGKALVIVESPAKAKTINKYLGKQFVVKASLGHIKDLPKKDLAVDVEHGFEPRYEIIEGKKKLIAS